MLCAVFELRFLVSALLALDIVLSWLTFGELIEKISKTWAVKEGLGILLRVAVHSVPDSLEVNRGTFGDLNELLLLVLVGKND